MSPHQRGQQSPYQRIPSPSQPRHDEFRGSTNAALVPNGLVLPRSDSYNSCLGDKLVGSFSSSPHKESSLASSSQTETYNQKYPVKLENNSVDSADMFASHVSRVKDYGWPQLSVQGRSDAGSPAKDHKSSEGDRTFENSLGYVSSSHQGPSEAQPQPTMEKLRMVLAGCDSKTYMSPYTSQKLERDGGVSSGFNGSAILGQVSGTGLVPPVQSMPTHSVHSQPFFPSVTTLMPQTISENSSYSRIHGEYSLIRQTVPASFSSVGRQGAYTAVIDDPDKRSDDMPRLEPSLYQGAFSRTNSFHGESVIVAQPPVSQEQLFPQDFSVKTLMADGLRREVTEISSVKNNTDLLAKFNFSPIKDYTLHSKLAELADAAASRQEQSLRESRHREFTPVDEEHLPSANVSKKIQAHNQEEKSTASTRYSYDGKRIHEDENELLAAKQPRLDDQVGGHRSNETEKQAGQISPEFHLPVRLRHASSVEDRIRRRNLSGIDHYRMRHMSGPDRMFVEPSQGGIMRLPKKKKHRPDPIHIPPHVNHFGFHSRLRSPRLWEDRRYASPPPYTPPPMLSPVRSGPGLFWHIRPDSITPKIQSAPVTPRMCLSRRSE